MTNYLYYPGCSMEGSGRSYRESLEGICEPLGITFEEIDDQTADEKKNLASVRILSNFIGRRR